jgi:hypothetical protein
MRDPRHPIRSDPMQGLMLPETFGRQRGLFPLLAIIGADDPAEQIPYLVGQPCRLFGRQLDEDGVREIVQLVHERGCGFPFPGVRATALRHL